MATEARAAALQRLDQEAARRFIEEQRRCYLTGSRTPAMAAERDRIRRVHNALRARIQTASLTELGDIDVASDATWAPDDEEE